jgi:biopolymer transport protein ExbB/TolQ
MKRKNGSSPRLQLADTQRSRLDVNLGLVLAIAVAMTAVIYFVLFPFRSSFLGILLYERGLTQYLVVWLASIVITFTAIKWLNVSQELRALRQNWHLDTVGFDNYKSQEVINLQNNLAKNNSLLAWRCSRVIAAYIQSGSRQTATEFALDDSAFYLSNSESAYAFPRILVWAIPLLGFIGTVLGISQAVNGFSGFLEKAGEIEQIREGIGTVTSGLAVAFDTTLLALLLSVLVMIPLVLVERQESRLLLRIEMYINDYLLPRFQERKNNLDKSTIDQAVGAAIKNHLPTAEQLIEPAHNYAERAVKSLTDIFVTEILKVQDVNQNLIDKLESIIQTALQDRDRFTVSLETQQKANQSLGEKLDTLINNLQLNYVELSQLQQKSHQDVLDRVNGMLDLIKVNYRELSAGISQQAQEITEKLERAAKLLSSRINSLEAATTNFQEIAQLKGSIDEMNLSLDKVAKVEVIIAEVLQQMQQLKPSLDKLAKPRIVTFLEQDE